jgi:AraC-like DNA-binding protein
MRARKPKERPPNGAQRIQFEMRRNGAIRYAAAVRANGRSHLVATREDGPPIPAGINDNSPTLQGWVGASARTTSPVGTGENRAAHSQLPGAAWCAAPSAPDRNNGHALPSPPGLCRRAQCPLDSPPTDLPSNPHLARILDLPQRAGNVKFSPHPVAASYGMSLRSLERTVQRALGSTPSQCLACLGMRRAPALLATGMNVSETADFLGYEDHSHFSRKFKHWYGCSPKGHSKVANNTSPIKMSPQATK